jgi:hypothetical protein
MAVAGALAAVVAPAALAFPSNGGTETETVNAPADGLLVAQTDQLPAKATQGDVTVTPLTDEQFFSRLSFTLKNGPFFDFSDRILVCVSVTEAVIKNPNFFPGYTIPKDRTLQALFLAACLQTALEVSSQQPATSARPATAGCSQTSLFMSVNYTRSGAGYSAHVAPSSKRPRRPASKFTLSCQRTATGLHLRIRPRKRGQKLRSAVGPTLGIGVANPTKSPIKLQIAFTAR